MGRLARRLDDEAAEIELRRQFARRDPFLDEPGDAPLKIRKNVHGFPVVA